MGEYPYPVPMGVVPQSFLMGGGYPTPPEENTPILLNVGVPQSFLTGEYPIHSLNGWGITLSGLDGGSPPSPSPRMVTTWTGCAAGGTPLTVYRRRTFLSLSFISKDGGTSVFTISVVVEHNRHATVLSFLQKYKTVKHVTTKKLVYL